MRLFVVTFKRALIEAFPTLYIDADMFAEAETEEECVENYAFEFGCNPKDFSIREATEAETVAWKTKNKRN